MVSSSVDASGNWAASVPAGKTITERVSLSDIAKDSTGNSNTSANITVRDTTALVAPTIDHIEASTNITPEVKQSPQTNIGSDLIISKTGKKEELPRSLVDIVGTASLAVMSWIFRRIKIRK